MARRQGATPGAGSGLIAAAVAIFGSERNAARELGVSRGTIHGILTGRQQLGARTVEKIGASGQGERLSLVASTLSAGRTPSEVVKEARVRARQERKEPGITERRARAFQREMRRQGLDVYGDPLRDARGYRITEKRAQSYETLLERYRNGELDLHSERYQKLRAALEADLASEDEIGFDDDDKDGE